MPEERAPSRVMMSATTTDMALAAIIESQRAQTNAVERQIEKLDKLSSSVAVVREEIAIMKVKDEQIVALTTLTASLSERINAVELRNAQQDGAGKFITILKDFTPWLLGIAVLLLAAFGRLTVS